jgi:hypothetical protein
MVSTQPPCAGGTIHTEKKTFKKTLLLLRCMTITTAAVRDDGLAPCTPVPDTQLVHGQQPFTAMLPA